MPIIGCLAQLAVCLSFVLECAVEYATLSPEPYSLGSHRGFQLKKLKPRKKNIQMGCRGRADYQNLSVFDSHRLRKAEPLGEHFTVNY